MKKASLILILLFGFGQITYSQTVTIGKQLWMTKNLDVSTFRNGVTIPHAKTAEEWKKAGESKQPAWCYYDNDSTNGAEYGKLYNWYAVNDPRGLAPVGYHIPTGAEWTQLTKYLGGSKVAGGKMKATSGWKKNVNTYDASNSSGFSGLPGGYCNYNRSFYDIAYYGFWWSSTEYHTSLAWCHNLNYNNGRASRASTDKESGVSVRCLRD